MASLDQNAPFLGTTPPISYAHPTALEIQFNSEMEIYMASRGDVYEPSEGQYNRMRVIEKLKLIIVNWARDVGKLKNVPENVYSNGGGIHLKIFGSTRLGVHTPDADIDALCVAPSYIDRSDFFNSFCIMMKSRDDIGMLSAVPDAYTPVVKFNIDGQATDMIFVSLGIPSIPIDLDVLNSRYLKGLDEQGIRSLNGSRVAEWICRLVPNFPSFCTTLRFIKHWARQRGLYSNVLGFLGGVNYAILVAFVCQRYPNACPATCVRKFFQMYTQWRWPNPIMLTGIESHTPSETDGRYLPVWNPKVNPKDGAHVMPIITPAFPSMNSSYNVGLPQFRLIQEEIQRGQMIFQNNKSFSDPFPWQMMCAPAVCDFFLRHPRYIQIDITADNADDHRIWFGWCESRLRLLILSLEQPPLIFCHPQANCFHRRLPLNTSCSPTIVLNRDTGENKDITNCVKKTNSPPSPSPIVSVGSTSTSSSSSSCTEGTDPVKEVEKESNGEGGDVASCVSDECKGDSIKSDSPNKASNTQQKPQSDSLIDTNLSQDFRVVELFPNTEKDSTPAESVTTTDIVKVTPSGTFFVSSFFIGLSFCAGLFAGNVAPSIQDFLARVNTWDGKKRPMEMSVKMAAQDRIPNFVFETRAEPSNMRACTPAKTNRNRGDDELDIGRRSGKKAEEGVLGHLAGGASQDGFLTPVETEEDGKGLGTGTGGRGALCADVSQQLAARNYRSDGTIAVIITVNPHYRTRLSQALLKMNPFIPIRLTEYSDQQHSPVSEKNNEDIESRYLDRKPATDSKCESEKERVKSPRGADSPRGFAKAGKKSSVAFRSQMEENTDVFQHKGRLFPSSFPPSFSSTHEIQQYRLQVQANNGIIYGNMSHPPLHHHLSHQHNQNLGLNLNLLQNQHVSHNQNQQNQNQHHHNNNQHSHHNQHNQQQYHHQQQQQQQQQQQYQQHSHPQHHTQQQLQMQHHKQQQQQQHQYLPAPALIRSDSPDIHSRVTYSDSLRIGSQGPGPLSIGNTGDALGGNIGGNNTGARVINTVGNAGIAGLNLSMSNDVDSQDINSPTLRQSMDGVDEQYIGQLASGFYAHSQPQSRTVVLLQPGQGLSQGLGPVGGLEPNMKKKNHNNSNNHHNHNGVTYNMNNNNNSNGILNNGNNQISRVPRNQTQTQNQNFQQQRLSTQRQRQQTPGHFVNLNNIETPNSSSFQSSSGVILGEHRGSASAAAVLSAATASCATGENLSVNSDVSSGSPQKRGRRDFQLSDNSLINIEADQNRTNMTDRKKNPPTAQYEISSPSISTTVISNVRRYCKDDEKMIEIDAKSY